MKMSSQQFLNWNSKSITLLGMSGAGKTTLTNKLPKDKWFHYSGDYRIGTKYLEEPILDEIKRQAMETPFLKKLLLSDSIYINSNITVNNLSPISCFLGKLGAEKEGGLSLAEFKRRQELHRLAEIEAMNDVPEFIHKAEDIYGYKHFINDAGGSVCELNRPEVFELLAQHSLILYIEIPPSLEETIYQRAQTHPKPLYYRESFLDEHLTDYLQTQGLNSSDEISPDQFTRWIFPKLFKSRVPRYQAIAEQYGYTVSANDIAEIETENDFIQLIADTIDKHPQQ